ncbi:MAG: hypothetical protein CBC01_08795 [Betaproteobacteria bacterium TMED41]|nr:MAG: hypothetical protein CBC01_08795 [Betaproteobacteria bacterium TMED41]
MNYESARKNLIEQHIRPWNVYNSDAINSLYKVPRENFVPLQYKKYAFSDFQVPLTYNDSMPSPMVEARILQCAITENCGEVLEIGSGSGYMAALLAQMYKSVITVEINQNLIEKAQSNLKKNLIENIQVFQGDGLKSDSRWSKKKFDAIVISGGVRNIPVHLEDSITPNGRIVAFLTNGPIMNVVIFKRNYGLGFSKKIVFETKVTYLSFENLNEEFKF